MNKKDKNELYTAIAQWRNNHTVNEAVDYCVQVVADDMEAIKTRHDAVTLCKLFYLMGNTGWTIKEAEFFLENCKKVVFTIRLSGSNDFVSKIDPDDHRCSPPGSVYVVPGWGHPDALRFETREEAETAARTVGEIEGFHTSVEEET